MGFFDAISGLGDLLSGRSEQRKLTREQIAATKEMNERNIASQEAINAANVASAEKINQSQIDFQQGINDMMRYDAKHAISDKKADLVRAGYSMADPSLQGFSAASLGGISPQMAQQVAPQVASEFDSSMAANAIAGRNSSINAILGAASTASTIALQKAQARSQNANATGQEIDNAWKEVQNQANLQSIYTSINESVSRKELNEKQGAEILKNLDLLDQNIAIAKENVTQLKFTSATQADRFFAELANLRAATADLKASKTLKESQAAYNDLLSAFQKIKNDYADFGINFDDNNALSSLLKLAHGGHVRELSHQVATAIGDIFKGLFDSFKDAFDQSFPSVSDAPNGIDPVPHNMLDLNPWVAAIKYNPMFFGIRSAWSKYMETKDKD